MAFPPASSCFFVVVAAANYRPSIYHYKSIISCTVVANKSRSHHWGTVFFFMGGGGGGTFYFKIWLLLLWIFGPLLCVFCLFVFSVFAQTELALRTNYLYQPVVALCRTCLVFSCLCSVIQFEVWSYLSCLCSLFHASARGLETDWLIADI